MRIEIGIKKWQDAWDWCNKHLSSDQWDMIYKNDTNVSFSVEETVYSDFIVRNE